LGDQELTDENLNKKHKVSTPGGKKTLRKKLPSKKPEENLVSVPSEKLTNKKKSKDHSNDKDESKNDSKKPKKWKPFSALVSICLLASHRATFVYLATFNLVL